jgi:endonuclease YncB( thermonuclease family)
MDFGQCTRPVRDTAESFVRAWGKPYARRVLRRAAVPLVVALLLAAGYTVEAHRRGPPAEPTLLTGTVVAIHDGDTLSIESDGRRVRIRLAQIDAPEQGQPWGRRAKQALAALADRRPARVRVLDRDAYGRAVGDVFVADRFVNEALVRDGNAWSYPRYVRDPAISAAEAEARREKRGLWRLPPAERQPPWQWRRLKKGSDPNFSRRDPQ